MTSKIRSTLILSATLLLALRAPAAEVAPSQASHTVRLLTVFKKLRIEQPRNEASPGTADRVQAADDCVILNR